MMDGFTVSNERYEYDVRALFHSFFGTSGTEEILHVTEEPNGFSFQLGENKSFCEVDTVLDFTARKREMKRALYHFLQSVTGRDLPWGALTGVRPTKLMRTMLEKGMSDEEALQSFRNDYLVSEEKSTLALQIAKKERALIESLSRDTDAYSIYVGIPFCPSRCLYCSFTSYPLEKWQTKVDDYLDTLCREIRETADFLPHRKIETIYIGGGTPTTLSAAQLGKLLSVIEESFDLSALREGVVECGRPDSITAEKLQAILDSGLIGRISINPQTMHQKTLDIIGRRHTVEEVCEKFALARAIGFQNINMDLIAGLPGEGAKEMRETLEKISALQPDSLTVHALAIKRAAHLNLELTRYADTLGVQIAEQIVLSEQFTKEMDLHPYYLYRQKNMAGNFENVGYAKPGKEGIYNVLIMEEVRSILAFGAGAISKKVYVLGDIKRIENPKDVTQYMTRVEEKLAQKRELFG